MSINLEILFKKEVENTDEFILVNKIAKELETYLKSEIIQSSLFETHKFQAKSSDIQALFLEKATELGFQTEKKGLFKDYQTPALRPDYYKPLSKDTGIIMEVERGKTVLNNMDLLDVWKCHICDKANYLFLIVPQMRHDGLGKLWPTYPNVVKRLQSFFIKANYINIDALFIFGY